MVKDSKYLDFLLCIESETGGDWDNNEQNSLKHSELLMWAQHQQELC